MTNEQKELLRQFDAAMRGEVVNPATGETEGKKKKSFMDKVKEAFDD